jgi:signal transduction histidine kinase
MDATVILDGAWRIARLNQAAEQLFNCHAERLRGEPVDVLFRPESRAADALAGISSGQPLQLEGRRAGVTPFRLEARLARVSDAHACFRILVLREAAAPTLRPRRRADSFQRAFELEKRRVSRELYDELGQRLSVLKLDMDWLERAHPVAATRSPERIAQMQALLDSVIIRIKAIASSLRPPLLDDLGLPAAVRWLAQTFERQTGIYTEVCCSPPSFRASDAADTAIYRVVQEALRNVERHARASHVRIEIRRERDRIGVRVQDDGVGMQPDAEHNADCHGLAAMQERIYTLGGTFVIHSLEGRGSAIEVSIPVEPIAVKLRTS